MCVSICLATQGRKEPIKLEKDKRQRKEKKEKEEENEKKVGEKYAVCAKVVFAKIKRSTSVSE